MKLAIAAACLAAGLSLASQAFADGRTVVTLAQPVAKPVEFVAVGGVWRCADTACVAATTPEETFGWTQCHAVAKQAGSTVIEFKDEYHVLQPAALDKCNTRPHRRPQARLADRDAPSRTLVPSRLLGRSLAEGPPRSSLRGGRMTLAAGFRFGCGARNPMLSGARLRTWGLFLPLSSRAFSRAFKPLGRS